MHKSALCLLMLATAFLAGCAEEPDEAQDGADVPEPQFESDVVQVAAPTMPRDPPAPGERTLDRAPEWRLGEWWTYRMTDGFVGGTYEFTRVVAGEDRAAGNYLVGFPVDEFSNDVMLFHIPGFGDIRQNDLAYETHDSYFEMLDFPLTDGKTWEAEFEGTGVGTATVAASGSTADIELITPAYNVVATYDAELGEISRMTINNGSYAQYEVVAHGYDYQGVVRVPHAHDLVFIHGRLAGVASVGQSEGDVPLPVGGFAVASSITETVTIQPGYDRVAFIIAVGAAGLGAPSVGYFQETVTAPDGTVYEETLTPVDVAQGNEVKVVAYGHDFPEGEWLLRHVAGGGGLAFVEGIGYHSIDIELPSGCVIASFNAQHHVADCKTTYDVIASNAGNATSDA